MRLDVRAWVAKAEKDRRASLVLKRAGTRDFGEAVGFHAQQCVEKYLKAFLVLHRIAFARTHDLAVLVGAAATVDASLGKFSKTVVPLVAFAARFRYPGASPNTRDVDRAMSHGCAPQGNPAPPWTPTLKRNPAEEEFLLAPRGVTCFDRRVLSRSRRCR